LPGNRWVLNDPVDEYRELDLSEALERWAQKLVHYAFKQVESWSPNDPPPWEEIFGVPPDLSAPASDALVEHQDSGAEPFTEAAPASAERPPADAKKDEAGPAISVEGRALAEALRRVKAGEPLKIQAIARAVGCDRSYLYQCKTFMDFVNLQRSEAKEFPRGTKDAETRHLEAWDNDE
jgi:hypothetical protein